MSTERTQEIEQTASEWLMHRDSGNWTEADRARFDEWMQASTLNKVAYFRLELGWEEARRLVALGAGVDGDDPPPPGQWNLTPFFKKTGGGQEKDIPIPGISRSEDIGTRSASVTLSAGKEPNGSIDRRKSQGRKPLRRWILAVAASILFAIAGTWPFRPVGHAYETPIGGTASVPIADGSKITLNTDSRIRVAFTDTERRIELKRGEVFFDVAQDPRRAFIVNVGHRRVIAIGTQFSVRREADDIQVVVTEGRVRVENDSLTSDRRSANSGLTTPEFGMHRHGAAQGSQTTNNILLTAGSIARATDSGILVQAKTVSEAEERLSWRTGVLMFRDQTLADAIAEFNRYNIRKLEIADPAIGNLKIEGNFRATNVDAFMRLVERVYPLTVRQQDDSRLLIRAH